MEAPEFLRDGTFLCGCFGVAGTQTLSIFNAYFRGEPPKGIRLPGFWIAWGALCLVGGIAAKFVFRLDPLVLATGTGAALAVLFQKWAKDTTT